MVSDDSYIIYCDSAVSRLHNHYHGLIHIEKRFQIINISMCNNPGRGLLTNSTMKWRVSGDTDIIKLTTIFDPTILLPFQEPIEHQFLKRYDVIKRR